MNTKGQSSPSIWSTIFKVLIFILALYLAYLILRPLLSLLLGIGFWFIKVIVFIAVAFIVIHLFLKIIFHIDLFERVMSRSTRR